MLSHLENIAEVWFLNLTPILSFGKLIITLQKIVLEFVLSDRADFLCAPVSLIQEILSGDAGRFPIGPSTVPFEIEEDRKQLTIVQGGGDAFEC